MEKRNGPNKEYVYIFVSIVLLILIFAEVSQTENYHSNSGTLSVEILELNQTDFIVIAKLPGVSIKAIMYPTSTGVPYANISLSVPENSSVASISLANFNSSISAPSITIEFNSTSSVKNAVTFSLGGKVNTTLSNSRPVSIMVVPARGLSSIYPAIDSTPEYDYLIIQASNIQMLSYTEVSR